MTLVALFHETVTRLARKPALVWKDRSWTWAEVRAEVLRTAGGIGVRRDDPVAILLPNGPENVFTQLAVQIAGGIRIPVNAAYTAREAAHPVEATNCHVLVTDEEHRAIAVGTGAERILVSPQGEPPVMVPEPSEISLVCFTSGTSGRPKGVPLTHANLLHNVRGLVEAWEWTDRDVLLLCLPLMHLHALHNGLNGWIATGCTLVLQEKFQPESVLEAIPKHRVTMFFGVPAMYHRLLEVGPRGDLSSMRLWVSGSAPLDRTLQERFEKTFGHRIANRYGMTETAMITANPARGERRSGSVGRPLPGMDVRVIDTATGRELPPGQTGEIVVRGPSVAERYWGGERDEATRHEGGFFRTGDLGYRDADGYFFITGRAKDIIISGGTNIAPLEIEEVLLQHPKVAEALALPAPDPALGEVVRVVVVPRGRLEAEEIHLWCQEHLARFKRPRDVRIVRDPLPRNAMQKLDRRKGRELYGG